MQITEADILEIAKMLSDLFKHLTTLNTGVIVIIITLVEKVFTPAQALKGWRNKGLIISSMIFLIASLLFSFIALVELPTLTLERLRGTAINNLVSNFNYYGAIYSFFFGVLIFSIFSIINLFTTDASDTSNQ